MLLRGLASVCSRAKRVRRVVAGVSDQCQDDQARLRDWIRAPRWVRMVSEDQRDRVTSYLDAGKRDGARAVTGGRRAGGRRLFRRADRVCRHQARHEDRARGNLRTGGTVAALHARLTRNSSRAANDTHLRSCGRCLDARHEQGAPRSPRASKPAPCGSTATTCSTPRYPLAATSNPAGAARWARRCSIATYRPRR